jgi:hypothetical protein
MFADVSTNVPDFPSEGMVLTKCKATSTELRKGYRKEVSILKVCG